LLPRGTYLNSIPLFSHSWHTDITKLKGPDKGEWYHLYVIIDIFSRYICGCSAYKLAGTSGSGRTVGIVDAMDDPG
jgi:transposase InsO family protein